MNLYLIDREIEDLLTSTDPETGEILFDEDRLTELLQQKENGIEDLALEAKNLLAEETAVRAEIRALTKRAQSLGGQAERIKRYLNDRLGGEKFRTARVSLSYTHTPHVELADGFLAWAKMYAPGLLREKEPEPNKEAIRRALNSGGQVEFARMVTDRSLIIR